jgi:CARDB
MTKTKTMLAASILLFCGTLIQATAQNPKVPPKPNPNVFKVFLPDFRIKSVKTDGGKMTVTVTNQCKAKAPASRMRLEIFAGPTKDSAAASYLENDVPALAAGAEATVSFDLANAPNLQYKLFTRHYYRLEADPLNKIKEASEDNNWYEKDSAPFPDPADVCNAK